MEKIKAIETVYNGYRFRSRLEARWAVFFDAAGIKYEYEPEGFELPDGTRYLPDFRVKCYGTRGNNKEKPFDLYIEVKGVMSSDDYEKILKFMPSYMSSYGICKYGFGEISEKDFTLEKDDISHERYYSCKCGFRIFDADKPLYGEFECPLSVLSSDEPVTMKECGRIIANGIPILVVSEIPNVKTANDCSDSDIFAAYEGLFFNYQTIDGDNFGAYPSFDEKGHFFLMGDDCNYCWCADYNKLIYAYQKARQARFEHGEKPII